MATVRLAYLPAGNADDVFVGFQDVMCKCTENEKPAADGFAFHSFC